MLYEHLCCSEGQEKSRTGYASSQPLGLNEDPVLLVNEGKSVSPESGLKGTESNGSLQDSREEQEGEEMRGKGSSVRERREQRWPFWSSFRK